jgi:hypothetical protein
MATRLLGVLLLVFCLSDTSAHNSINQRHGKDNKWKKHIHMVVLTRYRNSQYLFGTLTGLAATSTPELASVHVVTDLRSGTEHAKAFESQVMKPTRPWSKLVAGQTKTALITPT